MYLNVCVCSSTESSGIYTSHSSRHATQILISDSVNGEPTSIHISMPYYSYIGLDLSSPRIEKTSIYVTSPPHVDCVTTERAECAEFKVLNAVILG